MQIPPHDGHIGPSTPAADGIPAALIAGLLGDVCGVFGDMATCALFTIERRRFSVRRLFSATSSRADCRT